MILAGVPGVNNFEQSGSNHMHQSQILVNNKAPQILSETTQGWYSSGGSRTPVGGEVSARLHDIKEIWVFGEYTMGALTHPPIKLYIDSPSGSAPSLHTPV